MQEGRYEKDYPPDLAHGVDGNVCERRGVGTGVKGAPCAKQPSAAWRKVSERKVALPPGVMLAVRLIDRVSSDRNQAGDRFEGTLDTPVVVDGRLVVDKATPMAGRVVRVRK